jgi:ATP-dependent Clp protease ATP-binding subunit ClpC
MFEKYSDRARRVVVQAQEEARQYGAELVGPEHLLLALVQAHSEHFPNPREPGERPAPWDPAAVELLTQANRGAMQCGSEVTGTEHILLAALGNPGLLGRFHAFLEATGRVRAAIDG